MTTNAPNAFHLGRDYERGVMRQAAEAASEQPGERDCVSEFHSIDLSRGTPERFSDGSQRLPLMTVYLRREAPEAVPVVLIHNEEDDRELVLTADEALWLANRLDQIVGELLEAEQA